MIELNVQDRESYALMQDHNLYFEGIHTNLKHDYCACYPANDPSLPRKAEAALPDGGVCFRCGGLTVRTGTCTACTSCGESGGCG